MPLCRCTPAPLGCPTPVCLPIANCPTSGVISTPPVHAIGSSLSSHQFGNSGSGGVSASSGVVVSVCLSPDSATECCVPHFITMWDVEWYRRASNFGPLRGWVCGSAGLARTPNPPPPTPGITHGVDSSQHSVLVRCDDRMPVSRGPDWGAPGDKPKWCKYGPWLAKWPKLTLATWLRFPPGTELGTLVKNTGTAGLKFLGQFGVPQATLQTGPQLGSR